MHAVAPAGPAMWIPSLDVFLLHWFTTYAEARAHLEAQGGFLFGYRAHFFVAEANAVRALGLDPADSDWTLIGHDWVRPADMEAWDRLRLQREIEI